MRTFAVRTKMGNLQHRETVLRSVAAACQRVQHDDRATEWKEFQMQVLTAVGEAFNNIVLHAYAGREDGIIEMDIRTHGNEIRVELRDFGQSFDPAAVPKPKLWRLPESGLGVFIIKELMNVTYRPGRPNVMILSKALPSSPAASTSRGTYPRRGHA